MTRAVVLYHGGCADGFTAAWVCHHALKADHESVELIPLYRTDNAAREEEVIQRCAGAHTVMVDYCWNDPEAMKDLVEFSASVLVMDHHKTAQPVLDELAAWHASQKDMALEIVFDMELSGAGLAFRRYYPDGHSEFVTRVMEYDLWRHTKGGDTDALITYLYSLDQTIENWDMVNENLTESITNGHALMEQRDKHVEVLVGIATLDPELMFDERVMPGNPVVVNCPPWLTSMTGHTLLEKFPNADYAVLFHVDMAARSVIVSMRSTWERTDVSVIAKANGGGGHRNAAGFVIHMGE